MPGRTSSPSPVEAWRRVAPLAAPLAPRPLALADAHGLRSAAAITAPRALPPFARAAMDGVACAARSVRTGVPLPEAAEARAGAAPVAVPRGALAPISTGAALPAGADAVVPVERVRREGAGLVLLDAPAPGDHVRHAGEDAVRGQTLAAPGARLSPARIALLAAAGVGAVRATPRPAVAVLVTGDELRPAGDVLGAGQVPEANGPALRALLEGDAAEVRVDHVPDGRGPLRDALADALERSDLVVSTGGASVGAHDHVRTVAGELGLAEVLWGLAVRPGAPTGVARRPADGRLLLALPGNPTAAHVVFLLLGRPLVRALAGDPAPEPRHVPVRLTAPATGATGRTAYVPATLRWGATGALEATPAAVHGAARAVPLAAADALLRLPPASARPPVAVPAGAAVDALPLDGRLERLDVVPEHAGR